MIVANQTCVMIIGTYMRAEAIVSRSTHVDYLQSVLSME